MMASNSNRNNSSHTICWGRTEMVYASYHPQYTTTIPLVFDDSNRMHHHQNNNHHANSTQRSRDGTLLFYVHVFRIYPHSSGLLTSTQHAPQPHSKTYCYGTAQFHMSDLLSTKHRIRMKRLRGSTCSSSSNNNNNVSSNGHQMNENKNRKYLNTGCVFSQLEDVVNDPPHPSTPSHTTSIVPRQLTLQIQVTDWILPPPPLRSNAVSRFQQASVRLRRTRHQRNRSMDDDTYSSSSFFLGDDPPSSEFMGLLDTTHTMMEIARPMPGCATNATSQSSSPAPSFDSDHNTTHANISITTNGGWVVVHRAAPVVPSVPPSYHVATIPFEDLYCSSSSDKNNDPNDRIRHVYDQPLRISMYDTNRNHNPKHRWTGVTQAPYDNCYHSPWKRIIMMMIPTTRRTTTTIIITTIVILHPV